MQVRIKTDSKDKKDENYVVELIGIKYHKTSSFLKYYMRRWDIKGKQFQIKTICDKKKFGSEGYEDSYPTFAG